MSETDEWVDVALIPVEVFAAGMCDSGRCPECDRHEGYGLCDAVEAWSDCNRAAGYIFRVADSPGPQLDWFATGKGHTPEGWERVVRVRVRRADLPKLTHPEMHPALLPEENS